MRSFVSIVATTVLLGSFSVQAAAISQRADDLVAIAPDTAGTLNVTQAMIETADAGIDLSILDIATDAVNFMASQVTSNATMRVKRNTNTGNIIDVHAHLVFPWFQQLVPVTGGSPTPDWSAEAHLTHMATYKISRTILGNSAPQANVYFGDKAKTVALARLINLNSAVIANLNPTKFSWYAVVPLPYVEEAKAEAAYAIDTLGAVGITAMTNHEGLYLGNPLFKPFFQYLNSRAGKTIIYIHPSAPYVKSGKTYIEANPTLYPTGVVEFYFETARCLMDLTYTQTFQNFTNIQYISAHVGGAFPSILDRMIKSVPTLIASSMSIYSSRVWWDSAGPTYPSQVQGLLAYGIPKTQLLFGTDFPYAPSFTYASATAALINDTHQSQTELNNILHNNAVTLFGNKIKW